MIGKIKGIVDSIDTNSIIVDVSGVGYLLHCSTRALSNMKLGGSAELFVETHVREDQITLFGFTTKQEKKCFLKLLTVKGVGPKLALQILSSLTENQIYIAIATKDNKAFSKVSGVGPKLVNRIFAELKEKDFADIGFVNAGEFVNNNVMVAGDSNNLTDAVSALVNLGINKSEAYIIVSKIISEQQDIDLNNLIRLSLNSISR